MLGLLGFAAATCQSAPGDAAMRAGRPEAAARLYQEGAAQGDGEAALKLGLLVAEQVVSGYGGAATWFSQACQLKVWAGCHNMGVAYEYGYYGLPLRYEDAEHFYRLAAERGYMQAQYNLGSMYANQRLSGDVEGLKWLLVAQQQARACEGKSPLCRWVVEDPPGHVARLGGRMTAQAVDAARGQAEAWRALR